MIGLSHDRRGVTGARRCSHCKIPEKVWKKTPQVLCLYSAAWHQLSSFNIFLLNKSYFLWMVAISFFLSFPRPHISFVILAAFPQEYLNETQFCNWDPLTYFLIHEWMLPYYAYLYHQTLAQPTQRHIGLVEAGFYGVFHFGSLKLHIRFIKCGTSVILNLPAYNWDTLNWNGTLFPLLTPEFQGKFKHLTICNSARTRSHVNHIPFF